MILKIVTKSVAKFLIIKKMSHNFNTMKTTNTLRNLLGITQYDMAQLLRVSRSQVAMFELGKRDLPLAAKILLGEMLTHLKNAKTESKALPQLDNQKAQKKAHLDNLLKENEYHQLVIARKIQAAEKKYKNNVTILQLTGFLAAKTQDKVTPSPALLHMINIKASKSLAETDGATQVNYEIKQELLKLEKLILEASLRKFV